jgi:hypothetical protein
LCFLSSSFLTAGSQGAHTGPGSCSVSSQCPYPGSPLKVSGIVCLVAFYFNTLNILELSHIPGHLRHFK